MPIGRRTVNASLPSRTRTRPWGRLRRRAFGLPRRRACRSMRRAQPRSGRPSEACRPRRRSSLRCPRAARRRGSRRAPKRPRARVRGHRIPHRALRLVHRAARLLHARSCHPPDDLVGERRANVDSVSGLDPFASEEKRAIHGGDGRVSSSRRGTRRCPASAARAWYRPPRRARVDNRQDPRSRPSASPRARPRLRR
jgi:hypothetical protein